MTPKRTIHWKKFIPVFLLSLPAFLLLDIAYDSILKELIWSDIFSAKNLIYKTLAAGVLAYFFSTFLVAPPTEQKP